MTDDDRDYRPCVGIMLFNREGRVFVGARIDTPGDHWQMPQGGIDKGEAPREAAFRELEEEIGTGHAEIVAEARHWVRYDVPSAIAGKLWKGKWRGQRQKWYLMRFLGEDRDINLDTKHPEFRAWRWVEAAETPKLIVPFKREVYQTVLGELGPRLAKAMKRKA